MKRISIVVLVLAVFFVLTPQLQAHPFGFHPSGDCQHYCGPSCAAAIASNEEWFGNATCANHAPGYQPVGMQCQNDFPGPQWNFQFCSSSGCVLTGKLKCNTPAGLRYPEFSLSCPLKSGELPAATLERGGAICIYSDSSSLGVGCGSAGQAVYF